MRRLPVFFVLDCSESMIGENLKRMNDGLQKIVSDLRKDPHALETVWVSVIAFAVLPERLSRYMTLCLFIPLAFLSEEELTSRLLYGN
ncbi:tellurium resistance protein (plasmid) [Klebsiella pneumoniae]|nr:tellurium resistance protein [Klebsiella pneumoniae]